MTRRPILLSWSTGKDSAHALAVLERDPTVDVRALLCTVREDDDRVAMHGVRRELLERQARSVGKPLLVVELPAPTPNDAYEQRMRAALEPAVRDGIEAIAFGDLFLEDVRHYREENNRRIGLESLFPLWGRDTRELAREMLASGLRAKLACVDTKQVPAELAGREYDEALLRELPAGADACGENGEFHTFVYDGPVFAAPIVVRTAGARESENFVHVDLVLAD